MPSLQLSSDALSPRRGFVGTVRRIFCSAVLVAGVVGISATGCDVGSLMCSPYHCGGSGSCTNYPANRCPVSDGCGVAEECVCSIQGSCTDAQVGACAAATSQSTCSNTAGCEWISVCKGSITACSDYTESECSDHSYCYLSRDCD